MNPRNRQLWALLFLVILAAAGIARLFDIRMGGGEGYPPYSTLRADPLGARVLLESLQRLPGRDADRWLEPLDKLPADRDQTVILAGMRSGGVFAADDFNEIDRLARGGSRVVVAFRARFVTYPRDEPEGKKPASSNDKKAEDDKADKDADADPDDSSEKAKPEPAVPPSWMVGTKLRWIVHAGDEDALKAPGAPAELPGALPWRSDATFDIPSADSASAASFAGWRVVYRAPGGDEPVLIERDLGLGSVVLMADAFLLSNEALQLQREPAFLAWLLGSGSRVLFAEHHLGVMQDQGVAVLARRYGLGAAFFTALAVAALAVWRMAAPFVPPPPADDELAPDHAPTAGLEALLRRTVSPARLPQVCLDEWRRTARAADAEKIAPLAAGKPTPAAFHNAAVRALKRRPSL